MGIGHPLWPGKLFFLEANPWSGTLNLTAVCFQKILLSWPTDIALSLRNASNSVCLGGHAATVSFGPRQFALL